MDWLINLFSNHESVAYTVIIYSIVIAVGVALGKVKVFGVSFGIACVLFMGIAMSHFGFTINEEIQHFVKEFGLILFVYTIGLQVGPGFFASFQKEGIKLNLLSILSVFVCILTVISIHYITGMNMGTLVGIMSGSVTNTPGLGAAQATLENIVDNPSIYSLSTAYAVAYPFGVFGIILVMLGLKAILKIKIDVEKRLHNCRHSADVSVISRVAIKVNNPTLFNKKLSVIKETLNLDFIVSRVFRNNEIILANNSLFINKDDIILVVINKKDIEKLENLVGERISDTQTYFPDEDKQKYVSRRINVTKRVAYSKKLAELNIRERFDVTITRVYRAGIEFVPKSDTKLQFGDTITVIGDKNNIEQLSKEFGNSKKRLASPHIAELFLGITLGVLLGSIPFSLFGISFKLGLAGGPLIVAILISRYGGKFSVTHYVSQSANLMIREIGIVLFLASVGLDAGKKFIETIINGEGFYWMLLGAIITLVPLIITALVARFKAKLDYLEVCGLLSGAYTDPPALAFSHDVTNSDAPALTYASIYPLTTFLRIMVAQLLIIFFI